VNHLDKVAGAIFADPIATGLTTVDLGTDRLKKKMKDFIICNTDGFGKGRLG
jgi:hypothetical protein